ncbi:putative 7-deoxyloganetic acid glucosyltransferase [Helianthus anomalus]
MNRIHERGRIVGWAPQQQVLNHPSVACFLLSHCGWNSVLDGVSSGLPFMCWPYFADQFINQGYVVAQNLLNEQRISQ